SPTSASTKSRPTSSTTCSCCCAAADAASPRPSACSMAVAPSAKPPGGTRAIAITPSLEQARSLAEVHNLIPVSVTFVDDCETPVSAFLKLRALDPHDPAFLLESAEQGQRVGRWSFIGVEPHAVLRWSLGEGGDPYTLAAKQVARFDQAP